MQDFVKKFFDLPVLILLLLLLYAFATRRAAPSATASVSALPAPSSLMGKSCRVTAPRLNVRSSPNGQIIRTLKHDDAVPNNGWEGSWIKTDSGYVHGQYVSC